MFDGRSPQFLHSFYSNPSQEAAIYSYVVLNRKPAMLQPWVEDVLFKRPQGIRGYTWFDDSHTHYTAHICI